MRWFHLIISCALHCSLVGIVDGHGTPIHVEAVEGHLVVSQGIADDGFAEIMFVEDDDEGLPFGELSLAPLGSVVLWNIPGLDIFGMDDSASLSIQPILRPVRGTDPIERRLVWYWNPQTEEVESSAAPFHLLNSTNGFVTLPAGEITLPPPSLLLAEPIAGQQGFHNHSLLYYALDDNSNAPDGAYGLFVRLTSNQYESSDPFLVVLNHGVAYDTMIAAAQAINFAADDLPGDYNLDGVVDAADYVFWRDRSSDDMGGYNDWRTNFGNSAGSGASTNAVPEPGALRLTLLAVAIGSWIRRRAECGGGLFAGLGCKLFRRLQLLH